MSFQHTAICEFMACAIGLSVTVFMTWSKQPYTSRKDVLRRDGIVHINELEHGQDHNGILRFGLVVNEASALHRHALETHVPGVSTKAIKVHGDRGVLELGAMGRARMDDPLMNRPEAIHRRWARGREGRVV